MLYQALPYFGWRIVTLTSIAVGSLSNQPLTPVQPPDTAVPLAIIVGACVAGIVLLLVVGGLVVWKCRATRVSAIPKAKGVKLIAFGDS